MCRPYRGLHFVGRTFSHPDQVGVGYVLCPSGASRNHCLLRFRLFGLRKNSLVRHL